LSWLRFDVATIAAGACADAVAGPVRSNADADAAPAPRRATTFQLVLPSPGTEAKGVRERARERAEGAPGREGVLPHKRPAARLACCSSRTAEVQIHRRRRSPPIRFYFGQGRSEPIEIQRSSSSSAARGDAARGAAERRRADRDGAGAADPAPA
jgi:hypothetical protein